MNTTSATKITTRTKVALGVALGLGIAGLSLVAYPQVQRMSQSKGACIIGGCSSEICSDRLMRSTCTVKGVPYGKRDCERQTRGHCGWTSLGGAENAYNAYIPPAYTPPPACVPGGCSGTICSDTSAERSICMVQDTDVCYQNPSARCERQGDGKCGWTQTPELQRCLSQYEPQAYTAPAATLAPPCGGANQQVCEAGTFGPNNEYMAFGCLGSLVKKDGLCVACPTGTVSSFNACVSCGRVSEPACPLGTANTVNGCYPPFAYDRIEDTCFQIAPPKGGKRGGSRATGG